MIFWENIYNSNISYDKHFLLIENFLIQEELYIYWKVKNQTNRKKASTEVPSQPGEAY